MAGHKQFQLYWAHLGSYLKRGLGSKRHWGFTYRCGREVKEIFLCLVLWVQFIFSFVQDNKDFISSNVLYVKFRAFAVVQCIKIIFFWVVYFLTWKMGQIVSPETLVFLILTRRRLITQKKILLIVMYMFWGRNQGVSEYSHRCTCYFSDLPTLLTTPVSLRNSHAMSDWNRHLVSFRDTNLINLSWRSNPGTYNWVINETFIIAGGRTDRLRSQ